MAFVFISKPPDFLLATSLHTSSYCSLPVFKVFNIYFIKHVDMTLLQLYMRWETSAFVDGLSEADGTSTQSMSAEQSFLRSIPIIYLLKCNTFAFVVSQFNSIPYRNIIPMARSVSCMFTHKTLNRVYLAKTILVWITKNIISINCCLNSNFVNEKSRFLHKY